MSSESPHPEYELVLMIISDHPDKVLGAVSNLNSVGEYDLNHRPMEKIRDIYFDTSDNQLGRHRLNLRFRQTSEGKLVTLKKSPGILSRNRNQRQETELVWSASSFDRIIGEISAYGVELRKEGGGKVSTDASDPVRSFQALGLRVIQDRETSRQPRIVPSASGESLAELALDSVAYHFGSTSILLDEVEIEAKSKNGQAVVDKIASTLGKMTGPELQRWNSGKLSTGLKIERLLREGRLKGLVADGGRLKREAFNLLRSA